MLAIVNLYALIYLINRRMIDQPGGSVPTRVTPDPSGPQDAEEPALEQRPPLAPQLPQPAWAEARGPGGADSAGEALRAAQARSSSNRCLPLL